VESLGLRCDPWRRLSISIACGRSCSHKCSGKSLSTLHSPVIKWFLNIWIACSAALWQWTCGGTNWKSMALAAMYSLSALDVLLSSHCRGCNPDLHRMACPCLYAARMLSLCQFLKGMGMMTLLS